MRFRERLVEVSSKAAVVFATLLFCLWMMSSARAATQAKILNISASHNNGNHEVVIELSHPLESGAVKVENQRNFIQVSLQGAGASPARNEAVSSGALEKVFAYQYQPDLARVRLITSRESKEFQSTTAWKQDGRFLRIMFGKTEVSDVLKSSAAAEKKSAAQNRDFSAEAEERIVKEILAGKPAAPASVAAPVAAPSAATNTKTTEIEEEPVFASQQKTGVGPAKSAGEGAARQAGRMGAGLLAVLVLMALAAMGLKRFQQFKNGVSKSGGGRILETITSHSLGAKKQLTIVKVADQYLLLGVTDQSVNLVATLPKSADFERSIDEMRSGGAGFESMLSGKLNFLSRKQAEEAFEAEASTPVKEEKASVRDIIKKRMEGFKPLY